MEKPTIAERRNEANANYHSRQAERQKKIMDFESEIAIQRESISKQLREEENNDLAEIDKIEKQLAKEEAESLNQPQKPEAGKDKKG